MEEYRRRYGLSEFGAVCLAVLQEQPHLGKQTRQMLHDIEANRAWPEAAPVFGLFR